MEVEFNSLTADVLGGHCGRPVPAIDIAWSSRWPWRRSSNPRTGTVVWSERAHTRSRRRHPRSHWSHSTRSLIENNSLAMPRPKQ
jgi:hypothetical protein